MPAIFVISVSRFLCGTYLPFSQAALCPKFVSGVAQGKFIHSFLFILLIDCFAATLRSAIPGVSLVASDSIRHVPVLSRLWLTLMALALLLWCPHQVH